MCVSGLWMNDVLGKNTAVLFTWQSRASVKYCTFNMHARKACSYAGFAFLPIRSNEDNRAKNASSQNLPGPKGTYELWLSTGLVWLLKSESTIPTHSLPGHHTSRHRHDAPFWAPPRGKHGSKALERLEEQPARLKHGQQHWSMLWRHSFYPDLLKYICTMFPKIHVTCL